MAGLVISFPMYTDIDGNRLTHEQLKKLLRRTDPQYKWWKAKSQRLVSANGQDRPPPGVRVNKDISRL